MSHNKRDNLNTMYQNSANIAMIGEDTSDKDEYVVDEPDIVDGAEDNEDEYDRENQDTPHTESDNTSTIQ